MESEPSLSLNSQASTLDVQPKHRARRLDAFLLGVLIVCTASLYIRAAHFQFVNYDDQGYVVNNVHILQGLSFQTFIWSMTSQNVGTWHPLTLLLWLLISTVCGHGPAAFHIINVLLHTLNVALLFLFVCRTTGRSWPAFFTAALWGLHPLRVESVAWVSELKDVLCATFWLSCMLAYARYSRRRTVGNFGLVALFDACALMSKSMAVSLPFALLLLDYWPLNRSDNHTKSAKRWWIDRVLEKLPLLMLSGIAAWIALLTEVKAATRAFPLGLRFSNAIVSYTDYLRDSFSPYHLIAFYPHPGMLGHTIPLAAVAAAGTLLIAISVVVCLRIHRQPYLAVGWFWFLGVLVPVIGFVQVGEQSRADRYTYLPSMGLTLAIVWGIADVTVRHRSRQIMAGVLGLAAVIALSIATAFTVGHWKDTDTLFTYIERTDSNNYLALSVLSGEDLDNGRVDEALVLARRAVDVAPDSHAARYAYGMALRDAGRLEEAVDQLKAAIALAPAFSNSFGALGTVRHLQASRASLEHSPEEMKYRKLAIQNFRAELAWNSEDFVTAERLGYELAIIGKLDDAIAVWQAIIRANPGFAEAHGDLADALRVKGDVPAAVEQYREAIGSGSKDPDWETNLVYMSATDPNASLAALQPLVAVAKDAVRQTNSQQVGPLEAYGVILARLGRYDDAVVAAKQAVLIANAAGQTSLAKSIDRQIARYLTGQSFVNGDQ